VIDLFLAGAGFHDDDHGVVLLGETKKGNPGEIRAGVPYKELRLRPTAARRLP
jgi:hypothetical protein